MHTERVDSPEQAADPGEDPAEGVRLDAAPSELPALRAALLRLLHEDEGTFADLFAPHLPLGGRPAVPAPAADITRLLLDFRLIEGPDEGNQVRGRSRIRAVDGRLYVLDPGYVRQYYQDLWPETDVLLDVLRTAPRGTFLDVATGCGILAIEGAARGHRVVATDLYESALQLARFNAGLNGVAVELRQGHLLEPVRGERFDLVLVLPHYTRVADQLRLEVLRCAPEHVRPGGTLAVAVPLEWEDTGKAPAVPAAVEVLLRPEAARGSTVRVAPIFAALKRGWFTQAVTDGDVIPGLTSRHRFLITVVPGGGGGLVLEMPGAQDGVPRRHVPLSRLLGPGGRRAAAVPPATAVVSTPSDVASLRELLAGLAEGHVILPGELPAGLLDACRYGARPCVTGRVNEGAAGAMLDSSGGVRPCTHGAPLARATDTMAEVATRWAMEAAAAAERRGCAVCPAAGTCSRCLFPHPLDEATYCELVRSRAAALPHLHRLLRLLAEGRFSPPLRIKLSPGTALLAARCLPPTDGDTDEQAGPEDEMEARVRDLRGRLRALSAWLLAEGDGDHALSFVRNGDPLQAPLEPETAEIAELVAEGVSAAGLRRYLRARPLPLRLLPRALSRIEYAIGG